MSNTPTPALADKVVDAGDGRIISFPGSMPDSAIALAINPPKETQFERDRKPQEGAGNAILDDIRALGHGIADFSMSPGAAVRSGVQAGQDYAARKQEGRSPLYNTAATGVTASGIMNTRPMEEAANRGDVGGVAGHMAVPIAQVALPAAIHATIPEENGLLSRALRDPNTGKIAVTPSKILERVIPKRTMPEAPAQVPDPVAEAVKNRTANWVRRTMPKQAVEEPVTPQGPQRMGNEEFERTHGEKISLAEKARQEELAEQEKLRTQHGSDLVSRAKEQEDLHAQHEEKVGLAEKAKQKAAADAEHLKQQHAAALNQRESVERREPPRLVLTEQELREQQQRQQARKEASEPEAQTRGMESAAYGKKGNKLLNKARREGP